MKLVTLKIRHAKHSVTTANEYFQRYLAMDDYQLKHFVGVFEELLCTQLALTMKNGDCKCPRKQSVAFGKLAGAIMYKKPAEPTLPPQTTTHSSPSKA